MANNSEFLIGQSHRLEKIVREAMAFFTSITPERWNKKNSPDKWSKKEILGHLTDSAANNHLRFVRAQLAEGNFITHAYEQDFFVASQRYQDRKPDEVIDLWRSYNLHLAHVIKNMNPDKINVVCLIGEYEPQTLAFVVEDYNNHIEHHLKQVYAD